jgi:hypothetical protein
MPAESMAARYQTPRRLPKGEFMTPAIMGDTGTNLFPNFLNRDQLRAATSTEAPIADPTYPAKTWADPNPPEADADGNVTYNRLPLPGEADTLIPFKLPQKWAGVYNLTNVPQFPSWTPAPTDAYISGPNMPQSPLNPMLLSTMQQAIAMLTSLGIQGQISEQTAPEGAGGASYVYPTDQTRKIYVITPTGWPNALPINVGLLMNEQNGSGVGAPGVWDMSNPASPAWRPSPINTSTAAGTVPLPAKPLAPGQSIVMLMMFGQAVYATLG